MLDRREGLMGNAVKIWWIKEAEGEKTEVPFDTMKGTIIS